MLIAVKRKQMIANRKVAIGKTLPVYAPTLVDSRQIEQQ